MSTLEHPDGEPPSERAGASVSAEQEPDGSAASEADAAADTDELAAAAPAETTPAETAGDEGSTLERPSPDDPFEADEIAVAPSAVRHAPRYGRFATVGGLLGLAIAFMLTPFATYDEPGMVLDPWGLGLLLAAILTPIGILVACMIALVADRRSRRSRG